MTTALPDFNHFKRIWVLKTVIESGGLAQAAARHKVTISAISQSLTTLEETLDRKLLVRRNRHIQPTPYCLELLQKTEPLFTAFLQMDDQAARTCPVPQMSWLNFGVSELLASAVIPRLIGTLKEKLPHLKLKLQVEHCDSLIKAVKRGDLCMALVTDTGSISGVSRYPLADDQLGVFATKGFTHDEKDNRLPIAILRSPQGGYPAYYSRFLRSIAKETKSLLTCDSTEVLYSIACSGAAAAVLPRRIADKSQGLLKDILPRQLKPFDIVMVSEKICDPREDAFLMEQLKSIF